VNVPPEGADRPDGAVTHEERRHQHRAQAVGAWQLWVAYARVGVEITALDRAPLADRPAPDPLTHLDSNVLHHRLGQIEARHRDELVRQGVERREAARVDAENAARLLQDHADRPVHVEAGGHRAAGLEERACLAGPAHALLEEPRVVDRDPGLLAERLEHALVVRGERARTRREGRDHADDSARDLERHAEHRANPLALVHVAARRVRVGADVVDTERRAALGGAAHDPLADRDRERAPRLTPGPVGRDVGDVGPGRIEKAEPHPELPIRSLTERLIRSRTDSTSRRAVMSWLVA